MKGLIAIVLFLSLALPAVAAGIRAGGPAEDAPGELAQYGQFVGVWQCRTYARVRDGSWQPNDWESTWSWYWVLEGHAIQDVWEVPAQSPQGWSLGTNLRIFDPETGTWRMAWTNTRTRQFDFYEASLQGDDLVMTGAIPARGPRPPHSARITFHDIETDAFQWRYEASLQGPDGPWSEQARLRCRRGE